jgi:hypothetical protein
VASASSIDAYQQMNRRHELPRTRTSTNKGSCHLCHAEDRQRVNTCRYRFRHPRHTRLVGTAYASTQTGPTISTLVHRRQEPSILWTPSRRCAEVLTGWLANMPGLVLSARGWGSFGADAANASAAPKSTAKHVLNSLLCWNHILNHKNTSTFLACCRFVQAMTSNCYERHASYLLSVPRGGPIANSRIITKSGKAFVCSTYTYKPSQAELSVKMHSNGQGYPESYLPSWVAGRWPGGGSP